MKRLAVYALFSLSLVSCSLTGTSSIVSQDSLNQLQEVIEQKSEFGKLADGSDGIGFTCTIFEGDACYLTEDLDRLRTHALGDLNTPLSTNLSRQLVQDRRVEYLDGSQDDSVAVLCLKSEDWNSYQCRSTQTRELQWEEWENLPIK